MNQPTGDPAAKVHPATRAVLPDDPMGLHALEVPGDADLMLRLLVEEYARIGYDLEAIMRLASDPNYVGFHGLLKTHGEDEFRRRIRQVLARTGVIRVKTADPVSRQLVQIQLPTSS